MDILVVGTERNYQELNQRLGNGHRLVLHPTRESAARDIGPASLIFDFNSGESQRDFSSYRQGGGFIFLNTAFITLGAMLSNEDLARRGRVFGFNGLDGFMSNACMEITAPNDKAKSEISDFLTEKKIEHVFVDDRVGMVTPRIICMIINEAYNTVQEGTASKSDIDLAMKLGTNYPYGPFEWCTRIGITHVYELLEALYMDTHDERFRISPLLKKEYLDSQNLFSNR
jgi:3-hydroxybutyryl-CoA dehydrogenase